MELLKSETIETRGIVETRLSTRDKPLRGPQVEPQRSGSNMRLLRLDSAEERDVILVKQWMEHLEYLLYGVLCT